MPTSLRKLIAPLLLGSLLLGVQSVAAQNTPTAPAAASSTQDPGRALDNLGKQLDDIKTTFNSKSSTTTSLNDLRTTATDVQQQADTLTQTLAPELQSVQTRLTVLGPAPSAGAPPETAAISQQRRQLERDKSKLDGQIKQAQLLSQDAAKLASQIVQTHNEQVQAQLGSRTDSPLGIGFWKELGKAFPDDMTRVGRAKDLFVEDLALAWAPDSRTPLLLCLFGGLLLIVPGRWLIERVTLALASRYMPDGHLRRSAMAVIFTLTVTLSIGVAAWLAYLGFNWNDMLDEEIDTFAQATVRSVFFAAFIAGLGRALLSVNHPSWRLPALTKFTARNLRWFPWLLGGAFLLLGVIGHFNTLAGASLPAAVATHAFLALLITGLVGAALARAKRARTTQRKHGEKPPSQALWIGVVFGLGTLGVVVAWLAVLSGYVALGFFISWQMLWIGMIVAAFYMLSHLQRDLFDALLAPHGRSGQRLQSTFSVAHTTLEQTSTVLSAVCQVLLLLVAVGTVLMPFGGGPHELFTQIGDVFTRLRVGELTIKPGAIFNAVLVFALGMVVVRIVRRWLAEQLLPKTTMDIGMQNSIVTLLNYVAVVIVFALALHAADVSLQSLTWIASALSVGIGFGLQAIVSNFISGLILLAERPVKVGDWVSMPGVEGDIRRINVRATEIQLSDRSTMIVPNSQFITQNLRNVTHGNALGRVKLSLPMPLDTDAAKVREIMLEALHAHESTLDTPSPAVTLDDITSSAMTFTGVAYVRGPREASAVKSALLFDILARLGKAQLPLSTPQSMVVRNLGPLLGEDSPAAPGQ
ncbi:mechanosensitive ion channel family protein [Dyella monticola]|uniref:Mechanosensitive ion channel family protein n=2 Tax=Dyella monticola TaxID=1927958 RepID=A0A370WT30_9GAMM|nr:mechanosensitive ion channel family protein [Dyella monticola]